MLDIGIDLTARPSVTSMVHVIPATVSTNPDKEAHVHVWSICLVLVFIPKSTECYLGLVLTRYHCLPHYRDTQQVPYRNPTLSGATLDHPNLLVETHTHTYMQGTGTFSASVSGATLSRLEQSPFYHVT